jgi:hypothetical protein
MKKLFTILLLSIIFNTTSFAKEVTEVWECKDRYDTSEDFFGISISEVLITAKITSSDSGEIDVAGITHKTLYGVQGFDRRWDFGDESSRYGFIIRPNGLGAYYEYTDDKLTEASLVVKCTKK